MIQRFQSLYLLLAGSSFGATFLAPFATSPQAVPGTVLADQRFDALDSPLMAVLFGLAAVVAVGAIFLYRDRPLQIRLSWGALVAGVLATVVGVLAFMQDGAALGATEVDEQLGVAFPALGAVGSVLAARYIRKDERHVRSADRLR